MTHNIQYIYLDNSHKQIAIAKEGYEQIKQTVERYRVCGRCERRFTQENPQVSLNWCKECFVSYGEGNRHSLTYLGLVSPEPTRYNGLEHKFINSEGYIYITGSESEIAHGMQYNQNNRRTLEHWQFPVLPERYAVQGEETRLHDNHMRIYGDVRKDAVLFVEYSEHYSYSPTIHLLFLVYRNAATPQEFNKRKGEGRKLWIAAKARLEASKDARGDYHIGEYTRSWTHESDLYHFIVSMLNEQETLKQLEQRKTLAAQPIDQDMKPGDHMQLSLTAYEEARLQQRKENQQ